MCVSVCEYECVCMRVEERESVSVCVCVCVWKRGSEVTEFSQVRWADLEAKKEEERRKREVGFCIGGSWGHVTEEEAQAILRGTGSSGDDCET